MSEISYLGNELDLFQHAVNWKAYYATRLLPYISGDVLEVGAGVGGTSRFLCRDGQRSWTCLEPDPQLAARLDARLSPSPLPAPTLVVRGTLDDLRPDSLFSPLLYIDVLFTIKASRTLSSRSAARFRSPTTFRGRASIRAASPSPALARRGRSPTTARPPAVR